MKTNLTLLAAMLALFGLSNRILAQHIATGSYHSLSVCSNNTIMAWGRNNKGQLGNGTLTDSNVPVSVSTLTGVVAITGGYGYCLALKNDSTVWAWGENVYGQLGNGTNTDSNVPVQVTSLTGVISIASSSGSTFGGSHSLALKNDGTVWAWGYNNYGQLGNGTTTASNVPIIVSSLSGAIAIAAGKYYSLVLKNDGTVWAWGANGSGELGNGTWTQNNVPAPVSTLTGVTAIAASGGGHSLALKNDNTVWAWGYNYFGALGNGTNASSNIPVSVSTLTGVIAIASGDLHSFALKNDNTVWTWGKNNFGQLGNGTTIDSNIPILVSALTGVIAISGGYSQSIILKNDGTVWAWGDNSFGEVGNGTIINTTSPVQVIGLCSVSNGIEENSLQNNLSIYPNPFSSQTTLQTDNFFNATLTVYNSFGQQVKQIKNISGQTITLNRDNLPSGIYFIQLTQDSKVITTAKLIITD